MSTGLAEFIKRYGTDGASLLLNHVAEELIPDKEDLAEEIRDIANLLRAALRGQINE